MLLILAMSLKSESMTIMTMINQVQAMLLHQRFRLQILFQYNLYNTIHRIYDIFISLMLQVSCYANISISSQIMILLIVLSVFEPTNTANYFFRKVKLLGNSNIYTLISAILSNIQKEIQCWVVTFPDKTSATVC